jgi:REP element-mobilizing transposase RayT
MPLPIVIAYHLVWTAYGWWLPNDPRGSTSRTIRRDVLAELGELHHGRKKVQPASRDIRAFYEQASALLKHPLLEFAAAEVQCIAAAFARVIREQKYTCYACAIMPDHIHILIRKHKHLAEDMIANLQRGSRLLLQEQGLRTYDHPVWGGPGWKVFLDHPDDIRRTIRYIRNNPLEWHLPGQAWDFVQEYDGWPLRPGHSPNSPFARRLRGE